MIETHCKNKSKDKKIENVWILCQIGNVLDQWLCISCRHVYYYLYFNYVDQNYFEGQY